MITEFRILEEIEEREIQFLVCKWFWNYHNPIVLRQKKGNSREARIQIQDLEKIET